MDKNIPMYQKIEKDLNKKLIDNTTKEGRSIVWGRLTKYMKNMPGRFMDFC